MAATKPGCSCPRGPTCTWSPAAPALSLPTAGMEDTSGAHYKRSLARAKPSPLLCAASLALPCQPSSKSHRQRETLRPLPDPDPSLCPASFPSPTYPGKGPPAPPRRPSTGHLESLRCAFLARHLRLWDALTHPLPLPSFPRHPRTVVPFFVSSCLAARDKVVNGEEYRVFDAALLFLRSLPFGLGQVVPGGIGRRYEHNPISARFSARPRDLRHLGLQVVGYSPPDPPHHSRAR